MPSSVPTPLAAALGLVPAVLDHVLRLPAKAVQVPVYAVSSALTTLDTARRGYDDLAERGERLIARLRGTSFDEVEDRVEDALQGTVFAKPYDAVEDALEDAGDTVTALARNPRAAAKKATRTVRTSAAGALDTAADAVEDLAARAGDTASDAAAAAGDLAEQAGDAVASAADTVAQTASDAAEAVADTASDTASDAAEAVGDAAGSLADTAEPAAADAAPDEAGKGAPTPKATQPDATRVDTAASADVVETVERVSAVVGGTVLAHDELPLPDYDHLTLGSLRGRIRSLDLPQLIQLRDYEKAKADRLPIVTLLDNRIAKLASDPTAPLSGGDVSGPSAKAASPKSPAKGKKTGGSKVTPATSPQGTSAPRTAFGGLGGDVPTKN